MCGIFGIVAHNAQVPADLVGGATRSLAHRGPDDSGTILLHDSTPDPVEIGLGNCRLAILDLSPLGHQPMPDPETGNWIVYNGELYNFRDIRQELEQLGTTFVSHSDTEVLLKAYARWGEACLPRLRGMFAFAIWDAAKHQLFAARDPMGIKPFYYTLHGGYFIFASEVRTILGTGLVPRRLDQAGLYNYLTFGSVYEPLTLIDGVRSLPPGHSLSCHEGKINESCYWNLAATEEDDRTSAEIQPLLEEAIRFQLVSDVPIGVFLSGGIDSSALVSILRRGGVTPSTFSIAFREADFSEAQYSRAVAKKFNTDHHEITVSQQDVLAAIPDAIHAMDLPSMDAVNTYFVSRETRAAGVKVALSGLGGDEVFAGYSGFRDIPRMERFTNAWKFLPGAVRRSLGSAFAALTPVSDQNRKLASLARDNGRLLHPYFLARMLFTPRQRDQLCPSVSTAVYEQAAHSQLENLRESASFDPINRVSYLEMRCYMLNTLLRDADFMSMSQGLEVRVPLIDHHLAKMVLGLHGSDKLDHGTPKPLLVRALDNSLPDEIVHRPKRGFTLPFEPWLRGDLRGEVESVLESKFSSGPLAAVMDAGQVRQVWRDFLSGTTSWSRPWSLFVLQRWSELHL